MPVDFKRHQAETAEKIHRQTEERLALIRRALEAVLMDRDIKFQTGKAMYEGKGVWWPELAPLEASERTLVLREIRKACGLPVEGKA